MWDGDGNTVYGDRVGWGYGHVDGVGTGTISHPRAAL